MLEVKGDDNAGRTGCLFHFRKFKFKSGKMHGTTDTTRRYICMLIQIYIYIYIDELCAHGFGGVSLAVAAHDRGKNHKARGMQNANAAAGRSRKWAKNARDVYPARNSARCIGLTRARVALQVSLSPSFPHLAGCIPFLPRLGLSFVFVNNTGTRACASSYARNLRPITGDLDFITVRSFLSLSLVDVNSVVCTLMQPQGLNV